MPESVFPWLDQQAPPPREQKIREFFRDLDMSEAVERQAQELREQIRASLLWDFRHNRHGGIFYGFAGCLRVPYTESLRAAAEKALGPEEGFRPAAEALGCGIRGGALCLSMLRKPGETEKDLPCALTPAGIFVYIRLRALLQEDGIDAVLYTPGEKGMCIRFIPAGWDDLYVFRQPEEECPDGRGVYIAYRAEQRLLKQMEQNRKENPACW